GWIGIHIKLLADWAFDRAARAQKHSVVDAHATGHALDLSALFLGRTFFIGDPDDLQAIRAVFVLKLNQVLDRRPAMHAPGAPKIEQHQPPTTILAILPGLAVYIIQGEVL